MEKVRLGDCFSLIRNGANIKQSADAAGIPITRIETIADRNVNMNKMGFGDIYETEKYQDFLLRNGDILMSHINSLKHLAKTAIVKEFYDGK